jgi:signal transduction histidine kinase
MSTTASANQLLATRPRPRALLDIAVATFALAGSLAQLSHGGIISARGPSGGLLAVPAHPGLLAQAAIEPVGVALAVCATVPLIAWRRSPLGVFVATAAASVLMVGLGYPLELLIGPAAALYLVAARRERQSPWTSRTTVAVAGLLVAYLGAAAAAQRAFPTSELLHTGMAWAIAWFAGERTRLRREHIAQLEDRAHRAEREVERERLLAVAEERARIARDLHDAAGHAINVIAVRAGAARLRQHQDPARSRQALAVIEDLARQTAAEIDQMVGTLREGGSADGVEAPTRLASINTLIAHRQAAGLKVTLDASGAPRPLGTAADQAAYRILQEALTNAARHGTGDAQVALAFNDTAVELTVTNPVPEATRLGGRGHGLIGMRERAALVGGSLDAGRVDGTFRVHARIPYGGHGR